MVALSRRDSAAVDRLRDLLERYRPSARPVADELIHELEPILESEGTLAMRPVYGDLGWSLDFCYSTRDTDRLHDFLATAGPKWSPFFPVTPPRLRNRAIRQKPLRMRLAQQPGSDVRQLVEVIKKTPGYGTERDDIGVAICDSDIVLAWFGATRMAQFGGRELAIVQALVPALRARMLLEHQLGHALATRALLDAALEAIPTAAFILVGSRIEHANATGKLLLDRERSSVVDRLRESLRAGEGNGPFAITAVEAPGSRPIALAVLRPDRVGELARRLAVFAARHELTRRQLDVLALLSRGYGNKTIAERIGVAEGTVEEHVTLLLQKTGAESRSAVVAKLWIST
jgi:DNA-binding CsgD family transcriptional regulator